MTTQPEALRLAAALTRAVEQEAPDDDTIVVARWFVEDSAAELRRQHEAIQKLVAALKEIFDGENKSFRELCSQARAAIAKGEAK